MSTVQKKSLETSTTSDTKDIIVTEMKIQSGQTSGKPPRVTREELDIKIRSHNSLRPGTAEMQARSQVLTVGMRVCHVTRGYGEVVALEGNVRVIKFDAGDEHTYGPESLHKISASLLGAEIGDGESLAAST